MSTLKAQFSVAQAQEFLRSHYGAVEVASELVALGGGRGRRRSPSPLRGGVVGSR